MFVKIKVKIFIHLHVGRMWTPSHAIPIKMCILFLFVVVTARLREIREMAWFDTADQRHFILTDRQHPSYLVYFVVKESWSTWAAIYRTQRWMVRETTLMDILTILAGGGAFFVLWSRGLAIPIALEKMLSWQLKSTVDSVLYILG
jgi:hypothetical protein